MTPTIQKLEIKQPAGYHEISTLDWYQFRSLLWHELASIRKESESNWENIAYSVNRRYPSSRPQPPSAYRLAFERLAAVHPEIVQSDDGVGHRIWNQLLYTWAQSMFGNPVFMNLGFVTGEGDTALPATLQSQDEFFRLPIQLYHHLLHSVEIKDRRVLEVGCGGGGGCSYVSRYLNPALMVGLDLVQRNLATCLRSHGADGPVFTRGDALRLPFADFSFDVVVNIESSFSYVSIPNFLREVCRVLSPGGSLLIADLRLTGTDWGSDKTVAAFEPQIAEAGFEIVDLQDISAQVLHSMSLQCEMKDRVLTEMNLPSEMLAHFREILLCADSGNYRSFQDGTMRYLSCVAKKPVFTAYSC